MIATGQRDEVHRLARENPGEALKKALVIEVPWFRAQALSHVARFTDGDPVAIASEAAEAATQCDDEYKRTAVRTWEIAALARRGYLDEARTALTEALASSKTVTPPSSHAEALMLLQRAAFSIDHASAKLVAIEVESTVDASLHWRCKRAKRYSGEMLSREFKKHNYFYR